MNKDTQLAALCREHESLKQRKADVNRSFNERIKKLEEEIYLVAGQVLDGQGELFSDEDAITVENEQAPLAQIPATLESVESEDEDLDEDAAQVS